MSQLSDIEPKFKPNVIDLVKAAGIDVSDWANCNTYPSRNPKYCYEWAFVEPKKVVVLNLWYHYMEEKKGGIILRNINLRGDAKEIEPSRAHRAQMFDEAIQTALKDKLPVRVIVQVGKPPGTNDTVAKRALDPVPWSITDYDWKTGECTLRRGVHRFVDQFSIRDEAERKPERREVSGKAFMRSPIVRTNVLLRANGKCEWCGKLGFRMADGKIYLETHHVVPLSEDGLDVEKNVAALCPNHHREAHHGVNGGKMREKLLKRLSRSA